MHAPPLSKRLRLGAQVPLRGRFSWAPQVRVARVFGECGRCELPSFPSLLLSFLGVLLASLLRRMVTVFEDNDLLFWVPDVLCQHSEVVLWNLLSVEMFF